MEYQESSYPEFLFYNNETQTITLRPDSNIYGGKTYYFTIVIKEMNSDSVKYTYYATVNVRCPVDEDCNEIIPEPEPEIKKGKGGLRDFFKGLFGDDSAVATV